MPELPDVVLYVESLERLLQGATLRDVRVRSPFVLRTFSPMIESAIGKRVEHFSRRGKRIVWEFSDGPLLLIHPMIAGRFHWKKIGYAARGKNDLIAFDFDSDTRSGHVKESGTMVLTEASKKKRAGVWVLNTIEEVNAYDPGGLDLLTATLEEFTARLHDGRHTLKRALSDPHKFDGIGNAYGDEILHAAKLSPLKRTDQLSSEEIERLFHAARETMTEWIARLREQTGDQFPERVTAFRPEMHVHGKFKESCPICDAPIQRIRYSDNECNYCPGCQTGGRILSDRSLARLLKDDWPKTLDELES
ncbi:MAG: Fpg/Nei family DNA glycosylase [Rubripirellula sp.]